MVQQKKYSTRDLVILDILGISQPAMFFFIERYQKKLMAYPLVNKHSYENITIFIGKIHY